MKITNLLENSIAGMPQPGQVAFRSGRSETSLEEMTAGGSVSGSVASVAKPMGKMIKRESGITKGIKKSVVDEAEISENDLIVMPGQMSKRSRGFVSKDRNEMERIEMAKSDVVQSVKSAKTIFSILKNSDDEIEGWVQEKLAKAEDYLNTVREYLEGKSMPNEAQSASARMQKALQREKEKREYSERYAEKHFPIGKKPEPINKEKEVSESKTDFGKMFDKKIGKHNAAVVKTKKEIGTRVADIGPGGKEYNVKTDKEWDKQKGVAEGRVLHRDLKSWTDDAKSQGLSVIKPQHDVEWTHHATDKTGKIHGKFVTTNVPQNSRGFIHKQGVTEGRKPFRDLKSWADHAKSQGLKVSPSNHSDWTHDATDKEGKVRGRFVTTHVPQNSRGFIHQQGVAEGSVEKTPTGLKHHGDFPDYPREKGKEFNHNIDRLNKSETGKLDKAFGVHWNKGKNRQVTGDPAGVKEGAKVDRMVKHVKSSEKKLGHSDKEAENIAWATANKRGMLNNKNKKVDEESEGLWANIHAKRERIKHGSGEHMRKPGSKGAPTADALRKSAK
jgi:hypothetical protein